jgi:hypothetical protein
MRDGDAAKSAASPFLAFKDALKLLKDYDLYLIQSI